MLRAAELESAIKNLDEDKIVKLLSSSSKPSIQEIRNSWIKFYDIPKNSTRIITALLNAYRLELNEREISAFFVQQMAATKIFAACVIGNHFLIVNMA